MEPDVPVGHSDYVTKALLIKHQLGQRTTSPPKAEFVSCKLAVSHFGGILVPCTWLSYFRIHHAAFITQSLLSKNQSGSIHISFVLPS